MFQFMLPSLVACFVLTGIHAYLGLHVVERQVIFVDLALAQVAALGTVVAVLLGMGLNSRGAYFMSLSFTFVGAAVFSLTRTEEKGSVPQEAVIGIVYAVAASVAILALSKSAEAAEHLQEMLVGNIMFVTWRHIGELLALYGSVGLFHFIFRRQFLTMSFEGHNHGRKMANVRFWDFLFYMTFGIVVTSSVSIAGVLLVFSFLIVPSVTGVLFAKKISSRLAVGWTMGVLVSIIGIYSSVKFDFPTGATVVCSFGVVLVVLALLKALLSGIKAQSAPDA